MRVLLVGYDDSEEAERALVRAAEIGAAFNARLVVLSVTPPPQILAAEPFPSLVDPHLMPAGPPLTGGTVPPSPPGEPGEPDDPARRQLERARSVLAGGPVEAEYVSAVGDPAEALLQAADEHDADLIVVGSREHGFVERLLGGGVDERIARRSHRDVLLVH